MVKRTLVFININTVLSYAYSYVEPSNSQRIIVLYYYIIVSYNADLLKTLVNIIFQMHTERFKICNISFGVQAICTV